MDFYEHIKTAKAGQRSLQREQDIVIGVCLFAAGAIVAALLWLL